MELSFSEIVVVCLIAFLVFGPEEFVRRSHELGRFLGKLKTQASNFRVMAEAELMKNTPALDEKSSGLSQRQKQNQADKTSEGVSTHGET